MEAMNGVRPRSDPIHCLHSLPVKISNRAVNELGTGGITGPAMIYAPAADSKAEKDHP